MRRNDKSGPRPLKPVDPHRLIMRLTFSPGKAAALCGISQRQLRYWSQKGFIRPIKQEGAGGPDASRHLYDFAAVYRALLIKREIDAGDSLHRAVQTVDRMLQERLGREREIAAASAADREQFLISQIQRLPQVARRLRQALAGRPGGEALLALARALSLLPAGESHSDPDVGLRDDPKACCRLADALDRLDALLAALPAEPIS